MSENIDDKKIIQEIKNLDKLPPVTVTLPVKAAWLIICQIQLATRHSANTKDIIEDTRYIAEQIQHGIDWPPNVKKALEMGWDPKHDIDLSQEPSMPPDEAT